jgi:hypothetical protein
VEKMEKLQSQIMTILKCQIWTVNSFSARRMLESLKRRLLVKSLMTWTTTWMLSP